MIVLILLVTVAPILFYVLHRIKNKRMYELAAAVPKINGELPLLGIAHFCLGSTTEALNDNIYKISCECNDKGGVVRLWFGPFLYFLLTRAEDVDFVLKNHLEKLSEYELFQDVIGNSTINSPVPIWRKHRKILMAAFTSKMIDSYMPTLVEKGRKLASKLSQNVDKGEFELLPYFSKYELDIVCETTYGVSVNCQDDSNHPFLTHIDFIMKIMTGKMFNPWQRVDWFFKRTPQYSSYLRAREELYDFILEIIRTKRKELTDKQKQILNGELYDPSTSKIPSFLELVLNLGEEAGFSDTELMQELLALTIAGTDTSAMSLCFIFELLAKYPDIQEKVYEEIYDVLGDSDRPIEKEDLPKFKYMERVIKESLRISGPSSLIGRNLVEETKLPSGYTLPAGAGVLVSIYGMHRNPKYWGEDVAEFNPDRFLPEKLDLVHPCSYLPFSSGPRNCPGFHVGNMTLKIAIADILRQFKIIAPPEKTAIPDIKAKFEVLTKPRDGVRVTLKRRTEIPN